jgi:L-lactate dehydrogenase (cytochrome)
MPDAMELSGAAFAARGFVLFERGRKRNTGDRAMKVVTCIEDLREIAHRKVPRMFVDYAESGSYAEETLRANRADLQAVKLAAGDVGRLEPELTTILGKPVSLPLALSPVGLLGMQHGDGEILAAQAAEEAGIPFTLSTMSVGSIEDVAEATGKPFWFQLYVMKDRGFIRSLIERAAAAKCSALVLTVDLQILGQRHKDIKNGLSVPPKMKLANLIDIATKPAWVWNILRQAAQLRQYRRPCRRRRRHDLARQLDREPVRPDAQLEGRRLGAQILKGKLIVKGVMDTTTRKAVKAGADAIVVSNHGGRQPTAHPPRSPRCPGSPTRSATRPSCCSTAACARART